MASPISRVLWRRIPPRTHEDCRALLGRREPCLCVEGARELRPLPLRLEERDPFVMDVTRRTVLVHDCTPGQGGAGHVRGGARQDLRRAERDAARLLRVRRVLRPLVEDGRELHRIARSLVERLERFERPGPSRGVEQPLPGADRAPRSPSASRWPAPRAPRSRSGAASRPAPRAPHARARPRGRRCHPPTRRSRKVPATPRGSPPARDPAWPGHRGRSPLRVFVSPPAR
jgi:hypothetical protein